MTQSTRAIILGSIAVLSWSTVATAFKIALLHLTTFQMVLAASVTALIIFAVWNCISGTPGEFRKLTPGIWVRFAILGLISPVAYYMVLFQAYDYLPAQIAQPVNYFWPIILTVLLAVVSHKSIPASKYIGMAVSLAGVAAISIGGKGITGSISVWGLILCIGSAFLWACYWMVNDSLKDKVSESMSLFLTFLFGTIYLGIGAIFMPMPAMSLSGILSGIYIGTFEMGLPFICFGLAIRQTDNPALINQMCYLSPFLSLIFISIILREPIMPTTYIGLALIVAGLVFNQYFAGKPHLRHAR